MAVCEPRIGQLIFVQFGLFETAKTYFPFVLPPLLSCCLLVCAQKSLLFFLPAAKHPSALTQDSSILLHSNHLKNSQKQKISMLSLRHADSKSLG